MSLHCLYIDHGPALDTLPKQLAEGDVVLLLGNAVYLAIEGTPWLDTLPSNALHVLEEDLCAAGLDVADGRVRIIDYPGWVALTEEQRNQRLWR